MVLGPGARERRRSGSLVWSAGPGARGEGEASLSGPPDCFDQPGVRGKFTHYPPVWCVLGGQSARGATIGPATQA
jgi:hypothetical protein